MDLIGAQVQRGELANLRTVIRLPVRQRFAGQRGACARLVLVADEIQQLGVCRHHQCIDGLDCLLAQLRLHIGRQRRRHLLERRVERVGLAFGLRHIGDGLVAPGHRDPRLGETACQPGAHIVGVLGEIARDVGQHLEITLVILARAQRGLGAEAQIAPERRVAVERHLPGAKMLLVQQHLQLLPVHLVAHLIFGRQLRLRDGIQFLQHLLPIRRALVLRRDIDLGQMVGLLLLRGLVVFIHRARRLRLAPAPLARVQGLEACRCGILRGRSRSLGCVHGQGQAAQAGGNQQSQCARA